MNEQPPDDFRNMEDLLRKILSQALGQSTVRPGVIGVNIIMAGNLPPGFPGMGGNGPGHDIYNPPIEITRLEGQVIATCELKGLFDEHVSVAVSENTLHIIGFDGSIRYRSSASLPPVVETSCTRTFHNGVLELSYLIQKEQPIDTTVIESVSTDPGTYVSDSEEDM